MATSTPPVGIDHPTAVPENPERDREAESERDEVGADRASE